MLGSKAAKALAVCQRAVDLKSSPVCWIPVFIAYLDNLHGSYLMRITHADPYRPEHWPTKRHCFAGCRSLRFPQQFCWLQTLTIPPYQYPSSTGLSGLFQHIQFCMFTSPHSVITCGYKVTADKPLSPLCIWLYTIHVHVSINIMHHMCIQNIHGNLI